MHASTKHNMCASIRVHICMCVYKYDTLVSRVCVVLIYRTYNNIRLSAYLRHRLNVSFLLTFPRASFRRIRTVPYSTLRTNHHMVVVHSNGIRNHSSQHSRTHTLTHIHRFQQHSLSTMRVASLCHRHRLAAHIHSQHNVSQARPGEALSAHII